MSRKKKDLLIEENVNNVLVELSDKDAILI